MCARVGAAKLFIELCIFNGHVMQLLFDASFFSTFVFLFTLYLPGWQSGNHIQGKKSEPTLIRSITKRNETRFILTMFLQETDFRLVSDEFCSLVTS